MPQDAELVIAPYRGNILPTSPLEAKAWEFVRSSLSPATRRAYSADFRDFERWCEDAGRCPLPTTAETIALYAADLAGRLRPITIGRRIVAIRAVHRAAGFESPPTEGVVRDVLAGISRTHGTAQVGKAALRLRELRRILEILDPESLRDCRDHALLLIGFAAALRRSELAALQLEDAEFATEGVILTIRRSKTDQVGKGHILGLPYGSDPLTCPVRVLQQWVARSGLQTGPFFRAINRHGSILPSALTGDSIARTVRLRALAAGIENPSNFAAHSLRAGFVTEAAAQEIPERDIMVQTRHRSAAVLRNYVRHGSLWIANPCYKLDL